MLYSGTIRSVAILITVIHMSIGISVSPKTASTPQAADQIVWPEIELQPFISGFDHPVHVTHAGDDSYRLFVVEQIGRIRIIQNNHLISAPFLDIREKVQSPWHNNDGGTEEGLLSVAFPQEFNTTGHFYIYYTNLSGDNVVSRFSTSGDPNTADPDSEYQILYLDHPNHQNHNGGQLAFGSDGYLYIGTGDGGGSGDPNENAQNPESLLGKILRIDVHGPIDPYTIPPSNPFTQTAGYRGEIWALGLRNPWRFSFDRDTDDLYIGDVGQNRREEIDYQPMSSPGGENYGWDILEGSLCFEPPNNCIPPNNNVYPIAEYEHEAFMGCSVTGGFVYRGKLYSHMKGIYFYADYCSAKIWGMQREQDQWINKLLYDSGQPHAFSTFGEDELGNLYIADRTEGILYRVAEKSVRNMYHLPIVHR